MPSHTFGIISNPSRIHRPKSGSAKRSSAPRRGLTGHRMPFAMSAERARATVDDVPNPKVSKAYEVVS